MFKIDKPKKLKQRIILFNLCKKSYVLQLLKVKKK